jgi:hypothetical protein
MDSPDSHALLLSRPVFNPAAMSSGKPGTSLRNAAVHLPLHRAVELRNQCAYRFVQSFQSTGFTAHRSTPTRVIGGKLAANAESMAQ